MQLTQMLDRACRIRGREVAIIEPGERVTWNDFARRSAQFAGGLRALGVVPGDRIAMLALNSHRYLEFFYGAAWAGGIALPLNHRLAPPELAALLKDSGATVLLVNESFRDLAVPLQSAVPGIRHVIFAGAGEAPAGMIAYEALLAGGTSVPDAGRGGDDVATIFYTGGTTGRPKGAMHSHDNMFAASMVFVSYFDLDDETVMLSSAPLFHVAAAVVVPSVLAGATIVLLPRFTPTDALQAISAHRATMANFVPTMLKMVLDEPDFAAHDLSSLDVLVYGAAPMPDALLARAMAALPKTRFLQAYGQTEVTAIVTILEERFLDRRTRDLERSRSVARPVMTADVRVFLPDEREAKPGEIGEIVARGPMIMKGYWQDPEMTSEAMRGGWLHTGDAMVTPAISTRRLRLLGGSRQGHDHRRRRERLFHRG